MIVLKRDRRKKKRIIQNDLRELQPLIDAGYPLKDIWEGYQSEKRVIVSYRHFIRTLRKLALLTSLATSPPTAEAQPIPDGNTKWKN